MLGSWDCVFCSVLCKLVCCIEVQNGSQTHYQVLVFIANAFRKQQPYDCRECLFATVALLAGDAMVKSPMKLCCHRASAYMQQNKRPKLGSTAESILLVQLICYTPAEGLVPTAAGACPASVC